MGAEGDPAIRRNAFDARAFAEVVRAARLDRGLTQAALAAHARLNRRTILRIEEGLPSTRETRLSLLGALDLPCGDQDVSDAGHGDAVIGRRLRARRRSLRISLRTVSAVLGVREMTLSSLERGLAPPRGGWHSRMGDDLAKCLQFRGEEELRAYLGVEE